MTLDSSFIAKRVVPKRPNPERFRHIITGSGIAQDRRSPASEGKGRVRNGLQHSLDEEPGDPEANRDGPGALAPSRPLPDVAG